MPGTDTELSFCARLAQQLITSNTADSTALPCAPGAAEHVSGQFVVFVESKGHFTMCLACGQSLNTALYAAVNLPHTPPEPQTPQVESKPSVPESCRPAELPVGATTNFVASRKPDRVRTDANTLHPGMQSCLLPWMHMQAAAGLWCL